MGSGQWAVGSENVRPLQQFQEFFIREARLLYDRLKSSALQIAIVKGYRNSQQRSRWVLQDVMASGHVMYKEPCALKRSKQTLRLNSWQSCLHDLLTS